MIPGWSKTSERQAKEILYRCMEELGATKAALYLSTEAGTFMLMTSYGFGRRDSLAQEIKEDHPMWDWVRRHRTAPAFLNEVLDNPALSQTLEAAGTARLLTLPLNVADGLVGFVDARDKGRRRPYSSEDIATARAIGAALEAMLTEMELFGSSSPAPATPSAAAAPVTDEPPTHLHHRIVEELVALLRELARLSGAGALAVTLSEADTVRTLVLHGYPLEQHEREALARHQSQLLAGRGLRLPPPSRWGWTEESSGSKERRREEIRSAIALTGPPTWLVLSVLTPEASSTGEVILAAAARHLVQAISLRDYRRAARNALRALLEPGETSYTLLRQHSQAVSELAQRMASLLHLSDGQEELVTMAAYLHDVGMRELDYSRLYRIERPGEADRRLFERHPAVGARIVESTAFPDDLAEVIRHHHERWDGDGYPDGRSGQDIPLASRIIHLAEVFDTLSSSASYKRPVPTNAALDVIRDQAGKQFDPDLVKILEEAARP